MKASPIMLVLALACGCHSSSSRAPETTTPEEAQTRLNTLVVSKMVTCDMKGASLEVVLSQISEQTGASVALDPRLCFTHGPATYSILNVRLDAALDELKKQCPDVQIEQWRGVLFVTKSGEPLLGPQTPLIYAEEGVPNRKVSVAFVHTPLPEVCAYLKDYSYGSFLGASWRVEPAISDRRVTATFHDIPLISLIEVVCRLADCKVVHDRNGGFENVFMPREPVGPDEQPRRKS